MDFLQMTALMVIEHESNANSDEQQGTQRTRWIAGEQLG